MTGKRKLLLSGYFGMRNTGDDAYSVIAAEMAKCQNVELILTAATEGLPVLNGSVSTAFPSTPRVAGQQRVQHLLAVGRADAIVFLGGSTFAKPHRAHTEHLALARLARRPVHAVGISVGPFRSREDERRVLRTLRKFSSISVRDRRSFDLLSSAGTMPPVYLGFDIATVLPTLPWWTEWEQGARHARLGNKAPLGVSLCGARPSEKPSEAHTRINRVVSLAGRVARSQGLRVRLLVMSNHPKDGDRSVTEKALRQLEHAGVEADVIGYHRDTRRMMAAIASCRAVIGMRLHAAVFAYSLGVPFALAPYHLKCLDFAEEIGLADELVYPLTGPGEAHDRGVEKMLLSQAPDTRLSLQEARRRARTSLATLQALMEMAG